MYDITAYNLRVKKYNENWGHEPAATKGSIKWLSSRFLRAVTRATHFRDCLREKLAKDLKTRSVKALGKIPARIDSRIERVVRTQDRLVVEKNARQAL